MKSENKRLAYEQQAMKERIKDNKEKIKMNKQLPYLVGNVVEVPSWDWRTVLNAFVCSILHLTDLTSNAIVRVAIYFSCSTLTLKMRRTKMAPLWTWTRTGKANARSSRHQPDRYE